MAIYRIIPPGDIKLTPKDPTTGKRRVSMVSGVQYVRQKISTRLRFFLGEWFLDQREGIPYYRDVFIKNPDLAIIRSVFRQVINSIQEVSEIRTLTVAYNRTTRTLGVEFDVRLVDGGVLVVRQPDAPFIINVQRSS